MEIIFLSAIALGIVGVIGKFIRKESFSNRNESSFHRMYLLGYYSILFFIVSINFKYDYFMSFSEYQRIDEVIPCLTENLKLSHRSKNKETWLNEERSDMKIGHFEKEIKLNYGGIIKETDVFINRLEDKTLTIENKLPRLFRKKKSNYILTDTVNIIGSNFGIKRHEITKYQSDSILISWGFDLEKVYLEEKKVE